MTRKDLLATVASTAALLALTGAPAQAQGGDQFVGDIIATGYAFCPKGYADAAGQSLAIADYQLLFSLIGTTYGGNGLTDFNLPNLQGRTPLHYGTGRGMESIGLGQTPGVETNEMTLATMASHSHTAGASTSAPNQTSPENHAIGSFTAGPSRYAADTPDAPMEAGTVTTTSAGGASFTNIAPVQAIRYCIALEGLYPPRN